MLNRELRSILFGVTAGIFGALIFTPLRYPFGGNLFVAITGGLLGAYLSDWLKDQLHKPKLARPQKLVEFISQSEIEDIVKRLEGWEEQKP